MYIPYNPCTDCKQKHKRCHQCAFKNAELNYQRALSKIIDLNFKIYELKEECKQGKTITVIV
jgi:hypothetical protein